MRMIRLSGDASPGNSVVRTVSPMTATKARERSSWSVKKRPSTTPISRMPAIAAATPMMEVSSQIRFSRFTSDVLAVRAVEHAVAGQRFHEARIVGANGLVAFHLFEKLAPAQAPRSGDLRHQKRFRTKCLGRALLGIHAQALNCRPHHDHAGHPDDDS